MVTLPDHTLDQQEFLDHIATRFRHHPDLRAVLRILRNTTVRTRHFALPWAELTTSASLGRRNRLYQREGVALAARAARAALTEADLRPDQVGSLIVVSCTGHALPGIDAHLVGALGLPPTVRRLPVMQMGCAGGAYALARAADLTRAYPGTHSLVIAIELPSLSYQGDDTTISTLVSQALFGDACAAAVICPDDDRTGLRLGPSWEYLLPDSLDDMVYWLNEHGFHFDTLPSVTRCIQRTCPGLKDWLHTPTATTPSGDPQFLIAHTGGPKIMDALRDGLGCDEQLLAHSRASLRDHGNTASVVVLDVLARTFHAPPHHDAPGLLVGFGPGVTTVALRCWWNRQGPGKVVG